MSAAAAVSAAPSAPTTDQAQTFDVGGSDAAALYLAAVAAVLEALYGPQEAPLPAAGSGVLPLQAAGRDESERLRGLLGELLREAPHSPGRLLPPSWLSFDDKRATANLRIGPAVAAPRSLRLGAVQVEPAPGGGLSAKVTVLPS